MARINLHTAQARGGLDLCSAAAAAAPMHRIPPNSSIHFRVGAPSGRPSRSPMRSMNAMRSDHCPRDGERRTFRRHLHDPPLAVPALGQGDSLANLRDQRLKIKLLVQAKRSKQTDDHEPEHNFSCAAGPSAVADAAHCRHATGDGCGVRQHRHPAQESRIAGEAHANPAPCKDSGGRLLPRPQRGGHRVAHRMDASAKTRLAALSQGTAAP